MNVSMRVRIAFSLVAILVVLIAGAFPAWVAESEEKAKPAKVMDIGLAKDPIGLLDAMEKRRLAQDERDKLLEIREADLKRLEEKMNKRITALEQLRDAIREDLVQEKNLDDANIKRLAKIFVSMKPKAAAASLMAMDRETAVKALKVVPEKVAAKILGKMDVREAVQLSEAIGVPIAAKRGLSQEEANPTQKPAPPIN
ncbi:MAG: hypothetical protein HQL94_09800 [Magnetococcales bacterium]|nr:hypothetical protein [Magnetococcales bacterium]MBF0439159.1 hypothetical protein [Magnetococcales bacterium]